MTDASERWRATRFLAVAWAVILLVALAAGWVVTGPWEPTVDPWDDSVARGIAAERTAGLDAAAAVGSAIADTIVGVALGAVMAAAAARWQRSWRPVAYFAVLVGGSLALYVIVTHVITRDRPPVPILDPGLVPDHSYPSGHVATSIVVYGGLALFLGRVRPRWRRWTRLLLLAPVVVLSSRLYQGAHHPTDVLASVVLTTAWLLVTARVLLPRTTEPPR